MKKIALAAVLSVAASTAFAGGLSDAVVEPEVIIEDTAGSSNGGIIVPVLALLLFAAAAS
ncbi:hypothetical protein [Nereida sp. MMG025]|uniref:hypothetical protein n=1 Tax=Nereida sp. MMG025 TaxID=2909981 RepID=UPI001F373D35|nr:hypothetical protein [Nereida sp. MMG025]MCF6444591.1 hypothetical protein [Nereida sp. MMG025]